MPRDAAVIWRGVEAPGLPRRSGWSLLYWMSYTESKESCWGQSIRGGQETETLRARGQAEMSRVLKAAPEQSFG